MIVQAKKIAISSAIGQCVHEHVDIYKCGSVFALVNRPEGEYHVSTYSPVSDRKLIYSRPLVRYFREKCGCDFPIKLHAWLDGEIVLFCKGPAGKNVRFHDGFSPVNDVSRNRYDNSVKIYGRRIIVSASLSEGLGDRLSAYRYGKMYAFFNDENGSLKTAFRNEFGTKAVKSGSLTYQIEKALGKGPWYGVAIPDGVVFSKDTRIDRKPVPINRFRKVDFTDSVGRGPSGETL